MSAINDVRVWRDRKTDEIRIYIHTADNRESCIYRTGNKWHAKGNVEGKLTTDELNAAKELAFYDNCWHTVYNDHKPSKHYVCPDCGGIDTCGGNCTVNRRTF